MSLSHLGQRAGTGAPETAVVTFQPLAFARNSRVFPGGLWCGERDGAILALQLFSAGPTDHRIEVAAGGLSRISTCSPRSRASRRLLHQRARKKLLLPRLLKLAPHVDQLDGGQRAGPSRGIAHFDELDTGPAPEFLPASSDGVPSHQPPPRPLDLGPASPATSRAVVAAASPPA